MGTLYKANLVENESCTRTLDGFKATVGYVVTDLNADAADKMHEAIETPGIPQRGDLHPTIQGISAVDISATPADGSATKALVIVNYEAISGSGGEPDETAPPQIEVGTALVSVSTNKDADGNQMFVSYIGVDIDPDTGVPSVRQEVTVSGEVSIDIPQPYIRLSRRENSNPLSKSRAYSGKINSGNFQGDEPHYWICKGITGNSDDGGVSYDVSYEFVYNDATWDATVVYHDEEGNIPTFPEPSVDTGSIGIFQVYEDIDFDGLNLGIF